jgi:hypothetical protein
MIGSGAVPWPFAVGRIEMELQSRTSKARQRDLPVFIKPEFIKIEISGQRDVQES